MALLTILFNGINAAAFRRSTKRVVVAEICYCLWENFRIILHDLALRIRCIKYEQQTDDIHKHALRIQMLAEN